MFLPSSWVFNYQLWICLILGFLSSSYGLVDPTPSLKYPQSFEDTFVRVNVLFTSLSTMERSKFEGNVSAVFEFYGFRAQDARDVFSEMLPRKPRLGCHEKSPPPPNMIR